MRISQLLLFGYPQDLIRKESMLVPSVLPDPEKTFRSGSSTMTIMGSQP